MSANRITWLSRESPSVGIAILSLGVSANAIGNLISIGIVSRNYVSSDTALFLAWWATVTSASIGLGLIEITIARKSVSLSEVDTLRLPARFVGEGITVTFLLVLLLTFTSAGIIIKGSISPATYLLSLLVFPVLILIQVLQRGEALSRNKFADSSIQLAIDGIGRAAITYFLVRFTNSDVSTLILLCSLSPFISILYMRYRLKLHFTMPKKVSDYKISPELLRLSASTVGILYISYLVAPWFAYRIDSGQFVTAFIASMALSRIPMQFMGSFFSPIMVNVSMLYDVGNYSQAKILESIMLKRTLFLILIYIPAYVMLGSKLLTFYLGSAQGLPLWILFGQASTSGLLLLCTVVQAILIARNRWDAISSAWVLAVILMTFLYLSPIDTTLIAVYGPLIVSSFVLVRMLYAKRKQLFIQDA